MIATLHGEIEVLFIQEEREYYERVIQVIHNHIPSTPPVSLYKTHTEHVFRVRVNEALFLEYAGDRMSVIEHWTVSESRS